MAERSRGRDTDREQPIRLCEDDKRKLYNLLDWFDDEPTREEKREGRMRRMELGIVALFVMSGSQVAALLGGPNAVTAAWHIFF